MRGKRISLSWALILFIVGVSVLFSSTVAASGTLNLIEERLQDTKHYMKESASILDEKTEKLTITTSSKDTSLTKEMEKKFKEELLMWEKDYFLANLANAETAEDIKKVKDDAAAIKKEKEETFQSTKDQYTKDVVTEETKTVILLSVKYHTKKDKRFFAETNHEFLYYDVEREAFLSNESISSLDVVKEFEKSNRDTVKTGRSNWDNVTILLLLFFLCTIPVISSIRMEDRAQT
ncbi:MAG: hypothetical protein LPK00_03635 [Bacillaceae bacterium]|nr:hypothetical protein [Bacillaceae bacterium]